MFSGTSVIEFPTWFTVALQDSIYHSAQFYFIKFEFMDVSNCFLSTLQDLCFTWGIFVIIQLDLLQHRMFITFSLKTTGYPKSMYRWNSNILGATSLWWNQIYWSHYSHDLIEKILVSRVGYVKLLVSCVLSLFWLNSPDH